MRIRIDFSNASEPTETQKSPGVRKPIKIDFSEVESDWRDRLPAEKQIAVAYKYCPRKVVERWLQENRTRGFFSMLLGYIFDSKLNPADAYRTDWTEVEQWYDHTGLE